ncbi:hypothetical protein YYC_05895 [Plasmodium yoelii 17X]|uniref:Uncharacterized protein n=1 Tax=Plasmodium yoelii 17X TaxID=1323249 RepID=V7P9L1_PLAYE|nr:hypothetical protein YYC_05895 [Plasmodium yoelii 17X]
MYQFKDDTHFKKYCTDDICDTNLGKINAGCLYFFDTFFGDYSVFASVAKNNIDIVDYIIIWLSYMLNLIKTQKYDSIKLFYDTYIKNSGKYTNNMTHISGYNGYKDLIDKNNYFLSMDMSIASKLYYAFNTLCDIYSGIGINNSNCANYLKKAGKFVEKYKIHIIDHNITEDNPYYCAFYTLLIDYENLKNRCKIFPSAPDITKIISEHVSEVTSSLSIARKLILILSILVVMAIFFGTSYKCKTFTPLRNVITNSDDGVSYRFTEDDDYCTGLECKNDTDKVNARCLHIFETLFKNKSTFENDAKGNIYIVQYILIWLSYVLSLIKSEEKGRLNEFYTKHIKNGERYKKDIEGVTAYKNYKDLIDRYYYLLSMDMSIISKLYDAFSTLCDIYIEFETNSNCDDYLEKAKKFVEIYDEFNEDYNNGKDPPYNQLLSTLSNDYYNLKNVCNDFPSLPTYSRRLVIKRTLIPIAFIFVAVSIFLGIAYKYSLFGFRKRFQKQKLREKIKNIIKKMIH